MEMASWSEGHTQVLTPAAAFIGIGFALILWVLVSKVKISNGAGSNGDDDRLIEEEEAEEGVDSLEAAIKCAEIQNAISVGATSFLFPQYKYLSVVMGVFSTIIFLFQGSVKGFSTKHEPCTYNTGIMCKPALVNAIFSTIAFLLGALTSTLSGFLGMKITTYANARTTLEARKGVSKAFITAFRARAVMGLLLAANCLLVLYVSINLFKLYYDDDWEGLYESITGYDLSGSSMALFGRVGGGIYTKAVDVIADNVGYNVGEIAGMGFDLFGSYAVILCSTLSMSYSLIISSMGIVVCMITTLFATDLFQIKSVSEIELSFKRQLLISTIFDDFASNSRHLFFCVATGLWAGLVIVYTTEYYTSNAYSAGLADSYKRGASTNVIFDLALGYKSVIIPIFAIAVAAYASFSLAAMYGIAVAALGMLSTIATPALLVELQKWLCMSHKIHERTDALDAAGNTTAAIGKGFAIRSAAVVSLALFRAFVSQAGIETVNLLTPKAFVGLIVGAMLPCWFSSTTMKSVGSIALKMVEEVRRHFNTIPGQNQTTQLVSRFPLMPHPEKMIPQGALVILTPLIAGTLFGVETLAGSLVSGVQFVQLFPFFFSPHVAISASNTGGAWDNAKKYIEVRGWAGAVEPLVFAPFFATHGALLFKLLSV
ncbi:H(+)-exporting diphosphatase [Citrus sinensis]|nr:H(+)-exporting diphosphatase [Citrus sinensis]